MAHTIHRSGRDKNRSDVEVRQMREASQTKRERRNAVSASGYRWNLSDMQLAVAALVDLATPKN